VTDAGDVIPGAEYTVINENTGVAAPIYSDRTGATLLSAPYFADSVGTIQFFIAQGTTFRVAASGGVGTYTDRYIYAAHPQASATDTTAGSLMAVGAFGLGVNFRNTPTATLEVVGEEKLLLAQSPEARDAGYFATFAARNSESCLQIAVDGHDLITTGGYNTPTSLRFHTADLERIRIDNVGRVGVGTNAPTEALEIGKGKLLITQSPEAKAVGYLATFAAAQSEECLQISVDGHKIITTSGYNTPSSLKFYTLDQERFRIDGGGKLLVGKTIPGDYTTGIEMQPSGALLAYRTNGVSGIFGRTNNGEVMRFTNNGSVAGGISVSGSTISISYSSDRRLKENISDAAESGSTIDSIQVRQYDWKADGVHQNHGLIAQELQAIVPDVVVMGDKPEDTIGIDYAKLVPLLIKEVQSLRARVSALESN